MPSSGKILLKPEPQNLVVTKPEKPARRLILCKAVGQSSRQRILQLLKKRVDDSAVRQEALMIVRAVILSGFLLLSNAAFAQHPSESAPAPQPPPTLGLMLRVVLPGSVSLQTTQQQQQEQQREQQQRKQQAREQQQRERQQREQQAREQQQREEQEREQQAREQQQP